MPNFLFASGAGLEQAIRERADMQAMIGDEFSELPATTGGTIRKVRQARYDLDENLLKPYFELDR